MGLTMKPVGKPDAGNPHVRFDERGWETGRRRMAQLPRPSSTLPLQALREQLRCKEIWVEGADRYRNPDEDLPADFDIRRDEHYATLGLPQDADAFIARVQTDMMEALAMFDSGLATNPFVRILKRGGGRIALTPLEKQEDPAGLAALKTEIGRRWPMTSLLDMLKEADLRIGFTNSFRHHHGPRKFVACSTAGTAAVVSERDRHQHRSQAHGGRPG